MTGGPCFNGGGTARALGATWRSAWAEALADRRTFWAQAAMMVTNDVVWVVFWMVFFRRVGQVRGWAFDDVIVLLTVLTTSVGATLGALANCRWIGQLAGSGQLDAALALPVPTLGYLLCRRVDAVCLGDGLFGVVLFAWMGHPTPARCALFALAVACASAVTLGFLVALGSMSFVTGPNAGPDLGLQALILFSSYPVDIFGGLVKVMLYGLVPAAFVGTVPARLVQDFDLGQAALLVAVAVLALAGGWLAFRRGLSRYTSGATWTQA